jgi:hypothetical protein
LGSLTCLQAVLGELGVQPLELGWLRGTLRLYNQLAQAPAHSLHGAVVRADWEDACNNNVKNWAWGTLLFRKATMGSRWQPNRNLMIFSTRDRPSWRVT